MSIFRQIPISELIESLVLIARMIARTDNLLLWFIHYAVMR